VPTHQPFQRLSSLSFNQTGPKACFGYYWIVGPMTIALLPLAAILNRAMLKASERMFSDENLKVRQNFFGFIFYMLAYSLILQPACVLGYISELLKLRKSWGTK
jgi:biofilm PGA synthesis N-glycosyltransferase PgaC